MSKESIKTHEPKCNIKEKAKNEHWPFYDWTKKILIYTSTQKLIGGSLKSKFLILSQRLRPIF